MEAPPALIQQAGDQRALQQDHRANQGDLPAILLPHRRLAKTNDTAGGKAILTNVPMPEFPPVVLRCPKVYRRYLEVTRRFAAQDANSSLRHPSSYFLAGQHRPANDA